MPILIDRRSFLKRSLATAAVLRVDSLGAADSVRWALLSDTHIAADPNDLYRGFKPAENLRRAVGEVKASPYDAILVNGDLARLEGTRADYDSFSGFARELSEHAPLVVTLGNHDQRANAVGALQRLAGSPQNIPNKLVTTFPSGPLAFVLMDSLLVTNIAPGQLGKAQRDWLADHLDRNAAKPTIVVVHHNPNGDSDNALVDADRFLEIVKPRTHVKAIIFGHTHTYRYAETDGLKLINLPAVGYNFADGEPVGWVEATLRANGGTFKLHASSGTHEDVSLNWR